jgi:protein-disulfide isomerase
MKGMTMTLRMTLLAASALMITACSGGNDGGNKSATAAGPSAAIKAPAGTEWSSTVVKTADGGYRMGNPDAKVKLIEYGALSCPHCAKFSKDSAAGMKALVAKGNLSYEFRPFLIHPQDVPAFLLAACNGPTPYFTITEQTFAGQETWLSKSSSITQAEQQGLQGASPLKTAQFLAVKLGLDKFMEQRGIPKSKAAACLSDEKALNELAKVSEVAQEKWKVASTPSFIIQGQIQTDANDWATIETRLKDAGA